MALSLIENMSSREWAGGTITLHYTLCGTDSDQTAYSTIMSSTPATYLGLVRDPNPSIEPLWVDTTKSDGEWNCQVQYKAAEVNRSDVGSVRIKGSTKGGTMHLLTSLSTVGAFSVGSKAAVGDNGNLIGVEVDGSVNGVDIPVPVFNFTATKVFAKGAMPNMANIYGLTAKVNNGSFTVTDSVTGLSLTFAAGELLFNGVDFGEGRSDGAVEFSYDFSASPNKANFTVGGITVASKKGWEYMWTRVKRKVLGVLKVAGSEPLAIYVEKVLEEGNFSGLGL